MTSDPSNDRAGETADKPKLSHSAGFLSWLTARRVGLALTTRAGGMLFLVGVTADGEIALVGRAFGRTYAVHAVGDSLFLATRFQIWRLENRLAEGVAIAGYDRLFIPQAAYTTGEIRPSDIAVDGDGRVLFANPLFSCVAELRDVYNFVPVWRPPFVSALVAEDRCHLNGIAVVNGRLRYATALAAENIPGGWRDRRAGSGVVMDVARQSIIVEGLSLPHSPRMYRGRLWLLESGTGYFGYVDTASRRFVRLTLCPGFLRGLAFVDRYAVVTVSRPRREAGFDALPIASTLAKANANPQCAVAVIDLENGDLVHWLRIDNVGGELGDVTVIEGARQPGALGLLGDPIRNIFDIGLNDSALAGGTPVDME
jgi:uncharacterized protein (TIGR03032 family)